VDAAKNRGGVFGDGVKRPPGLNDLKRPTNGIKTQPSRTDLMKKRPSDIKTPRTPASLGGKKSDEGKKEKRELKNKEPKKPDTVDVAFRLYALPKDTE